MGPIAIQGRASATHAQMHLAWVSFGPLRWTRQLEMPTLDANIGCGSEMYCCLAIMNLGVFFQRSNVPC